MIWWQALILLGAGVFVAMICILLGAWIVFRAKTAPGSGSGFLTDPKGDVFSIPDETGMNFPGVNEPSKDEKNVIERTNRFLKSLGGES